MPGISGLSLYLPPYRVQLADWCEWNDQSWDKIRNVVGHSFRMRGPGENVYTMAANAVWRLMQAYNIDPAAVGYLALGTESSSDNAVGAVVIRGLIDDALAAARMPALARDCEVPEYKQACLGGVYGLKGALRYLATDGGGRQAIVVCADIAEYERGTSGEPTQGAGAVAMLLEAEPRLLEVNLAASGSSSSYRLADFRKPFARFRGQPERADGQTQDLPVFNGRYSTNCYVDAVRHAMAAMLNRHPRARPRSDYFHNVDAVFMHRPYHRMPANGWLMAYLFMLAADGDDGYAELQAYANQAEIDAPTLLSELTSTPDLRGRVAAGDVRDAFPLANQLLRHLRRTELWTALVDDKLALGRQTMRDLGNLYSAALPAWLAAGLDEASHRGVQVAAQEWLALGYGSGDAAEALPMRVVEHWREAAEGIRFKSALNDPIDLDAVQYAALHDGRAIELPPVSMGDHFVIDHVGDGHHADVCDAGIEYYRYVPAR